ncbi:MAG: sigma factor-like helix-turn-helix DNA-binding protein [Gemmatimonadales bacterium]
MLNESVETIQASRLVSTVEISLDAPVERSESGSATFGERVPGSANGDIEDFVDLGLQREFLTTLFDEYLTPRERRITTTPLRPRRGAEALTLEGIGALLGVTRERVRQIRERAFETPQHRPR